MQISKAKHGPFSLAALSVTQRAVERDFEIIGEALNRIQTIAKYPSANLSGSYAASFGSLSISGKAGGMLHYSTYIRSWTLIVIIS
jgi:hypothetical protein